MNAPETPTDTAPVEWNEDDLRAAERSAMWFDLEAPPELLERYAGMHVAIYGEAIIDADPDFPTLVKRLEARTDGVLLGRVLPRYVPTWDEATRY